MYFLSFFLGEGFFTSGYLLHNETNLKMVSFVASGVHLSQCLVALGLSQRIAWVMYTGGVMQGTAYGMLYISSVTQLQEEFPRRSGVVTGFAMFASGCGSLAFVEIYGQLIHYFGWYRAMQCSALLLAVGNMTATLGMTHTDTPLAMVDETSVLLISHSDLSVKLSPLKIAQELSIYSFLLAFSAGVGPGFGFVVGFQKMLVDAFSQSTTDANRLFSYITISGLVGR